MGVGVGRQLQERGGCDLGAGDECVCIHLRAVFKYCLSEASLHPHPPLSTLQLTPLPESPRLPFLTRKGEKGKGAICLKSLKAAGLHSCISSAHPNMRRVGVLCKDGETEVQRGCVTSPHYTVWKRQCQNASSHFKIITKTYACFLKSKKIIEKYEI